MLVEEGEGGKKSKLLPSLARQMSVILPCGFPVINTRREAAFGRLSSSRPHAPWLSLFLFIMSNRSSLLVPRGGTQKMVLSLALQGNQKNVPWW